jgi:hypothetical protein
VALGGSLIPDDAEPGHRREAFNIMLSMPRGTDPLSRAARAREFAQAELADHKYVMVLHDHQANPHVHISVRAESRHGKRLNPRKADLHRWRETFAEKLRGLRRRGGGDPAGDAIPRASTTRSMLEAAPFWPTFQTVMSGFSKNTPVAPRAARCKGGPCL